MVDLDEDAITNPSGGVQADIDLSDETQDFRMLNNLSLSVVTVSAAFYFRILTLTCTVRQV
jgi:hypothetical protein